jgi:RND family efflux transporter MFP subunit
MDEKDKIENKKDPIRQVEQEEEIIFPNKDESKPTISKRKFWAEFSLIKFLALILLIAGIYFAGFLTSPEKFTGTMDQIKEWFIASKEKITPYQEKLTQAIESNIKKEPSGSQRPTPPAEGSGTKISKPKRKIKHWKAPMDPTFIREKPGKSPMGMDLIPVYEAESEKAGQIKINPTMVQNIGVKTVKVKRRTLTHKIRTFGTLTYDERKVHHIHTKYGGWIEMLHVDFTGQEVKKNDLLMEIYSPELLSTQEELVLAVKYKESLKNSPYGELTELADSLLASTKKRLELFDVPDHQIEALIRDKKITKTMHIHSPVGGFVIEKKALHGMHVQPGMSLYMIADLSNIWVLADIYEYEVPWIKVGQKVEMNLSYFPGKKFAGKVTFIDPFLDPKTRTNKVRMEFANPKWNLKPDMYANVTIKSTITKKGVAVPEQAVIHSGEKEIVIVQSSSGAFESRELTLGPQADGYYQVLKGLRSGETVVTSSSFLIDSESKLQEALGKFKSPKLGHPINRGTKKPPSGKLMLQMDKNNSGKANNNSRPN